MPFKVYFCWMLTGFCLTLAVYHIKTEPDFFLFPLNHALYVRASNNFGFRGILSPVISLRIAHVPSPLREKGGCFLGVY